MASANGSQGGQAALAVRGIEEMAMKLRGPILTKDFGDGWASKPAVDLLKVMVTIAGFDLTDLMKTIFRIQRSKNSTINIRTVERAAMSVNHGWTVKGRK